MKKLLCAGVVCGRKGLSVRATEHFAVFGNLVVAQLMVRLAKGETNGSR